VVKLHRFIPESDAQGVRQLAHYVVGIATEDLGRLTFTVGAIGFGVGDRMQRGYKFLCENYEDGDEIYVIGFSRGAFQARSLAGLVALAGIARSVAPETVAAVWDCYEQNKLSPDATARGAACRRQLSRASCGRWTRSATSASLVKRPIKSCSASTIPEIPTGRRGPARAAIDEPRGPSSPHCGPQEGHGTRWTNRRAGQFPGSHANVGGGFRTAGCRTSRSCGWQRMPKRRVAIDLAGSGIPKPDPLGELVSPTSDGVYRVSHVFPFVRLIEQNREGISPLRRALFGTWRTGVVPGDQETVNESIHESALARFGKHAPQRRGETVSQVVYRPANLAAVLDK
jgi:hypothetical protein